MLYIEYNVYGTYVLYSVHMYISTRNVPCEAHAPAILRLLFLLFLKKVDFQYSVVNLFSVFGEKYQTKPTKG